MTFDYGSVSRGESTSCMGGVITAGSARFEIYEPNVSVILCAHAYIYEVDFERACREGHGSCEGGLVLCYLMSLSRWPTQIISWVFAVYNLLFCLDLNGSANCRHPSFSPLNVA